VSNRQEWRHADVKEQMLPEGVWQQEPDKVQWVDDATGLDCLIVRGPAGALCGYVGVPEGHPCFQKEYDDVNVDVHGGLTFADLCHEGQGEGRGICHIPLAGRPDKVWWLGFDCYHLFDFAPMKRCRDYGRGDFGDPQDVYRNIGYVEGQVTHLAAQLASVREAAVS
jgi:hypothetical protein